ncbi:MAG: transcriptional repressor LexA [Longimicrobiaceae bacterium]
MPHTLTPSERRIFDYLVSFLKQNGYQPSVRDIGKKFKIRSTKSVAEHLQSLADKGYIERSSSRSRGVRILGLDLAPEVVTVPCYGKIAAGMPALLRENVSDQIALDRKLATSPASFVLTVKGDSMKEVGILDGDLVLVEPVSEAEIKNGEVVAARVEGEALIKRYFSRGGEVILEPANADFPPILVREHEDFAILGRVAGVFRRLPARTKAGKRAGKRRA